MKLEDKRANLIKEIMRKKEFYNGILLQDLYSLIKSHPQFDDSFKSANKNNSEQYKHSTRALLQHRGYGMKNFKNKHKDFFQISYGKWTYYNNPNFKESIEVQEDIEDKIKEIESNQKLNSNEKVALIKVRINQSKFRNALIKEINFFKSGSPIRDINNAELLVASHIVDYSDCEDQWEKGNFNNGLILSPEIDKLFDRKYISFDENSGKIIFSKKKIISEDIITKLNINKDALLNKNFMNDVRKNFFKKRNFLYGFKDYFIK